MLGILGKESSVRLSNWIKTLQFEQKKGGGLYGWLQSKLQHYKLQEMGYSAYCLTDAGFFYCYG